MLTRGRQPTVIRMTMSLYTALVRAVSSACCNDQTLRGLVVFQVDLPREYPMCAPNVTMLTPVRHINVAHGPRPGLPNTIERIFTRELCTSFSLADDIILVLAGTACAGRMTLLG